MKRFTITIFVAALCVAGGVLAASAVSDQFTDSQSHGAGPDVPTPDRGSETTRGRAKDPDGGPDWTVRAYRSRGGRLKCFDAVQVGDSGLGLNTRRGFQRVPRGVGGGQCTDLHSGPELGMAVTHNSAELVGGNGNTTVAGIVPPQVNEVQLLSGQVPVVARPTSDGYFLFVLDGERTTAEFDVVARYPNGDTKKIDER